MSTPQDRIQEWIEPVLDRTREHLRRELEDLIRELRGAAVAERDEATSAARADAEAAATALLAEAIAAEQSAAEQRLQHEVATARDQAQAEQQQALGDLRAELERVHASAVDLVEQRAEMDLASAVTFARADERRADLAAASSLLESVRALDAAASLTGILDALADGAARHTVRTALLVVRQGQLRGWRWSGFDAAAGDAASLTIDTSDDTIVARAFRARVVQTASGPLAALTPLAPSSADRAAIAVPVAVDREVVAVLYGDDDGGDARPVPSAWPELLEVLARHAGRCLEAMTARRLPAWLQPAREASAPADPQADAAAQRYARLLVSEIRMYHEAAFEAARREGNILGRLRPQIARAQQMYAEGVPDRIRARTDYFAQELLRTLAGGDATLLGQTT